MNHTLTITLADAADLAWAQRTVTTNHYLRAPVDPRARPPLGNMLPSLALLYGIHIAVRDSVIDSDSLERFTRIAPPSDFDNLSGGELGECVNLTIGATAYCSALGCPIGVVVLKSAKPKVMRIDTRWCVALVADGHTFDKWPIVDFVAEAMSADVLPVFGENTVTIAVLSASPQPAFIVAALVYVLPKLVNQGALTGIDTTMPDDVLDRLSLDPTKQFAVTVCNRRLLPTAAHAQAARVRGFDLQVLRFVVAWEESGGVSLAVALGEIGAILDGRSLTTTTLALPVGIPQTVLSNPRGILFKVCGEVGGGDMIGHVIRSFQRLTKPWDVDASPGHSVCLQDYSTTFPKFRQLFVISLFSPMYTDTTGSPIPGPSGKYGWAWRLPEPQWTWQDLECIKPRTLRLL